MKINYLICGLVLAVGCKNIGGSDSKGDTVIVANKDQLSKILDPEIKTDSGKTTSKIKNDTLSVTSKNIAETTCKKCDVEVVGSTKRKLQGLSYQEIYNFLCTFSESCSNNVEYSEFSNEILFEIISLYPNPFIEILSNNPALDAEYIYSQLASPLLDHDYEYIISLIKENKNYDDCKTRIIKSLEKAMKQH